jgi:hypothetical protein
MKSVRNELVTEGKAEVHRYFPDCDWVSLRLTGEGDVAEARELLGLAYQMRRDRGRKP